MREEQGYRVRYIKTHAVQVLIGENDYDWTIPQAVYNGENVKSYMTGVQYSFDSANKDDTIKFQMVHPTAGVVDEFADIYAINGRHLLIEYLAELYPGLIIRVVINNTGASLLEFKCNLLRHIYTR